jgi:hypothetical protein
MARGLTHPLTMGWPHKCVYYSFRVTRGVSEFFGVRAQVDLGLTSVDHLTG